MMTRLFYRWMILAALVSLPFMNVATQAQENGLPPLPKPKTAPAPKPKAGPPPKPNTSKPSTNLLRESANIPRLTFNQDTNGSLNPQTSGRLTPNSYYDEYVLTAMGGELLTIRLQSANRTL